MPEAVLPVSSRVQRLRKRLGWTQQKLADRLGVTQATVNRWERGHKEPKPFTLQRFEELEAQVDRRAGSSSAGPTVRLQLTLEIPVDAAPGTLESVLQSLARTFPEAQVG